MSSIRPCMGGFCGRRSNCPHHQRPTNTVNPAERLCDRGRDGFVEGRMLAFLREADPTEQVFPPSALQH